jgi:CRP/FNR family transcriptional regulator, cyclic AMP receptor protein
MMLQAAANVVRGTVPATVRPAGGSSLLLTENQQWIGGPPALMDKLSQREREQA